MTIPEPFSHLFRTLYPAGPVIMHGLPLFFTVHPTQGLRVAPADNEDVSRLECDSLIFGDVLDVCGVDAEAREGRIWNAFGLGIRLEIDQYSSSGKAATGMPICWEESASGVPLDVETREYGAG